MNLIRRLTIALCMTALALIAARQLILGLSWDWPKVRYLDIVATIPYWMKLLVWLALLGLPMLVGWDLMCKRGRTRRIRVGDREGERLDLRQGVIEDIVKRNVLQLPEVSKLTVRSKAGRNGVSVRIGLTARNVGSLKQLDRHVRQMVDYSMRRMLGIERIDRIDVDVEDMTSFERGASNLALLPPPAAPTRAPLESPVPDPQATQSVEEEKNGLSSENS